MRPSFARVPAAYLTALKVLHWGAFGLILVAVSIGTPDQVRWGIVAIAFLLSAGYASFGLIATPGPVLSGPLHGIFRAWRHTVLNDGALRKMTPQVMHGWL